MSGNKSIGVIFDMDGVLVDSEPVILAAAISGLKEYGVPAEPEDFVPFIGAGEDRYIGGVAEKYGIPYRLEMKARVYQIYLEIVSENLKVYKGTKQLLNALTKDSYTLALASSADEVKVKANLEVAEISTDLFRTLVTGEDVVEKKPSPEIYLKAAEGIEIKPEYCFVVEDALNGVKAAKSAGMRCIGVTTSFSKGELLDAGADWVCDDIAGVYSIVASNSFNVER